MKFFNEYSLYSLRKRIVCFIFAVSFIFFALVIRLFIVCVINSTKLQNLASYQWTRKLPMTAERGKIYDINGATLAVSLTSYDIYSRGREIKDITKTASFLSKKLNVSYDMIYQKLSLKNVSEVLIKLKVDSLTAKDIIVANLPGIFLTESVERYYPYGDLLTQILGFTTIDNVGQTGIEAYYNKNLKGQNGAYLVQTDLQGKEIKNSLRTFTDSVKGDDIKLTINVNFQLILEKMLYKAYVEQKAKSVSGIIMNAKTGEIVACANKPSFNLNNLPRDNAKLMMENAKNKIVLDVYEPGSTFKILTMASALESKKTNVNEYFYCPGYRVVDGQKIKCWKTIGHGSQKLEKGIVNSCNCVFMDLAGRMGVNVFYDYLKKFGIGAKTGVEVSGESAGIMRNSSYVKNVDLARIGFGQAIAVTPIQLITAICSVVNGGKKVFPTIINKIENKNIIKNGNKESVISKKTSEIINNMLKKVVNKQEEYSFVEGYDVGGKTGTAQKYNNGAIARGKYISSFVGTYPASNPDYVLLFMVDEPGAGAYYGGVVAAPYGKEIIKGVIEYLGDKPIKDIEKKYAIMPFLEGQSLYNAVSILKNLGINYEIDGNGDKIKKQLPPRQTKVDLDDTVILITN